MYVYYYRTYEKAVSGGGEREKGGHVLRDTTSRGLYVRFWPPHTSERRGGGGGCEQEGWQDFGVFAFLVLVRTGRRLPVQGLSKAKGVWVALTGYPRNGAPGP